MSTRASLVIPCWNESASLPELVRRCTVAFDNWNVEVVLVDNGSTDATPAVLRELLSGQDRIRSVRVDVNQGYGFGILSGLRAATGDVLAWTHADLQTDPGDLLRGLELFERSPHPEQLFVKGRRFGRPLSDVVFTAGMSVFETILLRRQLSDINAQPTIFTRRFFESWDAPPHDFSLDLYAFYLASKSGLEIARFPVYFGRRVHGVSRWNVNWRAKGRFIKRTVTYSLRLRRSLQTAR